MKPNEVQTLHGKWYHDACGGALGMELLGERWAVLILRELMFGGRRFSELRAGLPALSAKVLTERLHGLELSGILRRVRRTPLESAGGTVAADPAQIYELTPWGLRADAVLLALCRWALASPSHDPELFLSPAAMMMSLRALCDPALADGLVLSGVIRMGREAFTIGVTGGAMHVTRGEGNQGTFTIAAPGADPVKRFIYGKMPAAALASAGLTVSGDIVAADSLVALCSLPPKWI